MADSEGSAALAEIYTHVPDIACRLRCQDSCHDVPLLAAECDRLGDLGHGVCPKLSGFGTCSVHDNRPLACRLWGVAENMPCPHGCSTPGLPLVQARAVVAAAEAAGGGWID